MTGIALFFLPLILSLVILYSLSQLIDRTVMGMLGRKWYLALMWPGVIVHELSHFMGCLITFTRVREVKLFAPSNETLGYVSHDTTKNPISNIVISSAPLFGVSAIMLCIVWVLLPDSFSILKNFPLTSSLTLKEFFLFIGNFFQSINFSEWQTYLALFLLLTLSSHAAPSSIDLKHTAYGILGLFVLLFLLFLIRSWIAGAYLDTIVAWVLLAIVWLSQIIMTASILSAIMLCLVAIPAVTKRMLLGR